MYQVQDDNTKSSYTVSTTDSSGLWYPQDILGQGLNGQLYPLYKRPEKNEAMLVITLSVFAKTPKEQNKKIAQELRRIAEELESEVFSEEEVPDKESIVSSHISRG